MLSTLNILVEDTDALEAVPFELSLALAFVFVFRPLRAFASRGSSRVSNSRPDLCKKSRSV